MLSPTGLAFSPWSRMSVDLHHWLALWNLGGVECFNANSAWVTWKRCTRPGGNSKTSSCTKQVLSKVVCPGSLSCSAFTKMSWHESVVTVEMSEKMWRKDLHPTKICRIQQQRVQVQLLADIAKNRRDALCPARTPKSRLRGPFEPHQRACKEAL